MQDVWQRFNDYPAFVDLVDELKRELAGETAIEFDSEVASWVGPEISAGLLEFEIEQGRPVALVMGGPIGYRPGYVLHDQYLTLGTTGDALSTIVAVQDGREESLSSDGEYRRAVGSLEPGGQFLAYVDVRRVVGQIDEDDVGLEPDEYRLFRGGLGVVALGSAVGEDYSRGRVVLTLFPE